MGCRNVGRVEFRGLRERLHRGIVSHHKIEHMRKKPWVCGGAAQRVGPDSAFGEKGTQAFRIARDERKRLNCNDFSYFPRISSGFSQAGYLPFGNLWFLVSEQSCPSLLKQFKQVETTSQKLVEALNGLERIWR